jgi:antitoxin MazE
MRVMVRKLGNSSGIIVPKPVLAELGVSAGDAVEITLEEGRAVIVPVKHRPRAGWAEASRAIAETGDDGLVWPEFVISTTAR